MESSARQDLPGRQRRPGQACHEQGKAGSGPAAFEEGFARGTKVNGATISLMARMLQDFLPAETSPAAATEDLQAMTIIDSGLTLLSGKLNLLNGNKLEGDSLFRFEVEARADYAARRSDPLFESLRQAKQAALTVQTQETAQKTLGATLAAAAESQDLDNESGAVKAFLDYMAKSPEERYFEAFLSARGLTAEDYEAMSPKEQQGLLSEFEEALKRRLGDATAERIARSARKAWL